MTTKFTKHDVGIIIPGASTYNPTEQSFKILDFAILHGFPLDEEEYKNYKLEYELDELRYTWEEELGYIVEEALEYLNTNCVEPGYVFTFIDTDFVLFDTDYKRWGEQFD